MTLLCVLAEMSLYVTGEEKSLMEMPLCCSFPLTNTFSALVSKVAFSFGLLMKGELIQSLSFFPISTLMSFNTAPGLLSLEKEKEVKDISALVGS